MSLIPTVTLGDHKEHNREYFYLAKILFFENFAIFLSSNQKFDIMRTKRHIPLLVKLLFIPLFLIFDCVEQLMKT